MTYTTNELAARRRRRPLRYHAAMWVSRNMAGLTAWAGFLMVYFAFEYGLGFDLGWWAVLMACGFGLIWAGLRS